MTVFIGLWCFFLFFLNYCVVNVSANILIAKGFEQRRRRRRLGLASIKSFNNIHQTASMSVDNSRWQKSVHATTINKIKYIKIVKHENKMIKKETHRSLQMVKFSTKP